VIADQAGGGLVQEAGADLAVGTGDFGAVQHAGLRRVGVCPALARHPHDQKSYSIKSGYVNVTHREGERRFLLGMKPGTTTPQER
jgi:hypothetical protein